MFALITRDREHVLHLNDITSLTWKGTVDEPATCGSSVLLCYLGRTGVTMVCKESISFVEGPATNSSRLMVLMLLIFLLLPITSVFGLKADHLQS